MSEFLKRLLSSIILIPLIFYVLISGTFLFNIFILICFLIANYEWYILSKDKIYSFFGYIFITISFYTFFKLKNDFDLGLIILILLICISTDIGGYLFGKIFKGPKLTKFSPKKTYTGMIGSFLLPIFLLFILSFLSFAFNSLYNFNFEILIFTLLLSAVSQLGDIFISYFKRLAKIKDTGNIIPGHGGLLDRIDGMIFAIPFSYILIKNNFFQII
ncbi:phosphatidate cytidylyltransferase [Candidatus Pelagibacter sp.]|nr:phosphatidate cytidylyltransferase [Candidatus Pelagibacter sp.]